MYFFLLVASLFFSSVLSMNGDKMKMARVLGEKLQVNYKVLRNEEASFCQKLGADWASCYRAKIKLTNQWHKPIDVQTCPLAIIVPTPRRILKVETDKFEMSHLTGDLFKLQATPAFGTLGPGKSVEFEVVLEFWALANSDMFPNWMVDVDGAYANIANTKNIFDYIEVLRWDQAIKSKNDKNKIMNATTRFEEYQQFKQDNNYATRIIPNPLGQVLVPNEKAMIKNGVDLRTIKIPKENVDVLIDLLKKYGIYSSYENEDDKDGTVYDINEPEDENSVEMTLKVDASITNSNFPGGYEMKIRSKKILIVGQDVAGAMYGFASFLSLVDIQTKADIPAMDINDSPRYEYRGFMLDIARNFQQQKNIFALIDQMFLLKMNKFHLHLSDDEGWRLEIPGLPELTEVGSLRLANNQKESIALSPQLGHGAEKGETDGYLKRDDFIKLLKYAKARFITVIPEFDMPAHARAAVISMEARYKRYKDKDIKMASQYRLFDPQDTSRVTTVQFYNRMSFINVCLQSTLDFVDKIMSEVAGMYKEAGVEQDTWHFGGDEAKNIMLGPGFASKDTAKPFQGIIDQSQEDQPYAKSPVCQQFIKDGRGGVKNITELPAWFAKKINSMAIEHGFREFQAWQDSMKLVKSSSEMELKTTVNVWDPLFWGGVDTVDESSNKKKFGVILSNPDYLYMDFPYEVDPNESGYYWASRGTGLKKIFSFATGNMAQNAETSLDLDGVPMNLKSPLIEPEIRGISGHLWGELIRSSEKMEYMIYPRLFAIAERSWSKPKWEVEFIPNTTYSKDTSHVNKQVLQSDFEEFAGALSTRQFTKLDLWDVKYRVPKTGFKIVDNRLIIRCELPGMKVQYKFGTDSTSTWIDYSAGEDGVLIPEEYKNFPVVTRACTPGMKRCN